jgi:flagellar motility protein MotE (MotC chaperone)
MKAKIKKIGKVLVFMILGVILVAGIVWSLLHFKVVKIPAIINNNLSTVMGKIPMADKIPFLKQSTPEELQETELQKVKQENDTLKRSVAEKKAEMEALQRTMEDMDKKQKIVQQAGEDAKAEIIRLNEKLLEAAKNSTNTKASQQSIYKNMAQYFAEMNSKEAADLLSKLNDQDIIGVLGAMETSLAGEMLQKMPRDKATTIARKMLVASPQ